MPWYLLRRFKSLPTASATIKGFDVMHMIRKRQCLVLESGTAGDVRFALHRESMAIIEELTAYAAAGNRPPVVHNSCNSGHL